MKKEEKNKEIIEEIIPPAEENITSNEEIQETSPKTKEDRKKEFNKLIKEDPRVENVIIPLRDGLNLIRLKK